MNAIKAIWWFVRFAAVVTWECFRHPFGGTAWIDMETLKVVHRDDA